MINDVLPLMEVGAVRFIEEELIKYVIRPNISRSWVKDFKIGKGPAMTSTLEVLGLLKTIEAAELSGNSKNGRRKVKNKCRLHPQGNHE